jgi:hypothetical protein
VALSEAGGADGGQGLHRQVQQPQLFATADWDRPTRRATSSWEKP